MAERKTERVDRSPSTIADIKKLFPQFSRYLKGTEQLKILSTQDILPKLEAINSAEARDLRENLNTLYHIALEPFGEARRDIVLMEDKQGNNSIMTVCRDRKPPTRDKRDPAFGELSVIGGFGLYETPRRKNPLQWALNHTKTLCSIMRRKCLIAGLGLGGAKATVPAESGWLKSRYSRLASGFIYSPAGAIHDMITGTDVGSAPYIPDLAKGSEIGGGKHQIAGKDYPELDTPRSCRHSIRATYLALKETYKDKIPDIRGNAVSVEGFGQIGYTAVELMAEMSASTIYISDPILTKELDKLPKHLRENPSELDRVYDQYITKLGALREDPRFTVTKFETIRTDRLSSTPAKIFLPCSSSEGSLTKRKIIELHDSGVKVILSGANNPLGKGETWLKAAMISLLRIYFVNEVVTNCGSVTAASSEPILARLMAQDPMLTPARFVDEILSGQIIENTRNKMGEFLSIMANTGVSLYEAAEIWFRVKNKNKMPSFRHIAVIDEAENHNRRGKNE